MSTIENGSIKFHEQIAFELQKRAKKGFEISWVCHKSDIYWSQSPTVSFEPFSSTIKLIQFLFDGFVDHSFFILRQRIFSSGAITTLEKAFVDVCAKRATGMINPVNHQLNLERFQFHEMGSEEIHIIKSAHLETPALEIPNEIRSDAEAMELALRISNSVARGQILHDHNRAIGALLVSSDGQVLSWSSANNYKNKSLHAEVHLLQNYFENQRAELPPKAKIFVTLKPCRMCAELIAHMARDLRSNLIYYYEDDPGRLAKNTILEKQNVLRRWPKDVDN